MPFAAGQIVYEDDLTGANRVASTIATTNFGSTITTVETVTDTVTFAAVAGRTYKVSTWVPYNLSVANDVFYLRIREGLTTAGGQYQYMSLRQADTQVYGGYMEFDWAETVTGNRSFALTVIRNSGTGNITIRGAVSQPRRLVVDRVPGL